jgi:hypothetical protein
MARSDLQLGQKNAVPTTFPNNLLKTLPLVFKYLVLISLISVLQKGHTGFKNSSSDAFTNLKFMPYYSLTSCNGFNIADQDRRANLTHS